MATFLISALAAAIIVPASAQLSGKVGPLTTTAEKAATKICNILDYGGVAGATGDIGKAITSAWAACKTGGQVYIPSGEYGLGTWVSLKGGNAVSINIEGTIYRTGTGGGNMIFIEHSTDLEIYSATGTGAIQGYGYEFHKDGKYGPRILRLYDCTSFSVHDLALVDAPQFHFTMDTCDSGEVYNMIIHGGYEGGLDGIDVWGTNIWIHDVEVSNKDECVTVKDPSSNLLIESVHCNWSGGCAMGSLASGIDIHDIEYNNIYTHHSNQMYMIKSNGGNGTVKNIALNNFMGHSNAYTLDFDSAWSGLSLVAGDGIGYSNMSFSGWTGTCSNGVTRGPIKMNCPAATPCTDITVEDFNVWTDSGDEVLYACYNAYGTGACLKSGSSHTSYTTTQTVTAKPTGYSYTTMANELSAGFDISSSIPIPTLPASFFPGIQPRSAIAIGTGSSASTTASAAKVASSTLKTSTSAKSSAATGSSKAAVATTTAAGAQSSSSATSQDNGRGSFGSGTGQVAASSTASAFATGSSSSKSTSAASFGTTALVTGSPSASLSAASKGCGGRRTVTVTM